MGLLGECWVNELEWGATEWWAASIAFSWGGFVFRSSGYDRLIIIHWQSGVIEVWWSELLYLTQIEPKEQDDVNFIILTFRFSQHIGACQNLQTLSWALFQQIRRLSIGLTCDTFGGFCAFVLRHGDLRPWISESVCLFDKNFCETATFTFRKKSIEASRR